MAAYKAPREFVFLRQLPRNALGKVQKKPLGAALTRWLARP
jgi:acyl-CoA synthetase (AMP-forming)/AMP-acid ligase II